MKDRKKPEVDLRKYGTLMFALGLTLSVSAVLMATEFRYFEERLLEIFIAEEEFLVQEQVINYIPPPPSAAPKPPPPSVVEQIRIVENEVELEQEVEIDVEIDLETEVSDQQGEFGQQEEAVQDDQIFQIVEDMPRFAGCEKAKDIDACFQEKLYAFLGKNLKYPPTAKDMGITGKVYVGFVVEKDGSVGQITVLRDIGGGCGNEAKRVISNLPKFTPGKQRGRPVRVQYQLPINFQLR